MFETNILQNLWNNSGGSTNERPGSDHVIWGPMKGLEKKLHGDIPQTHGHSDSYERIGQGPILWKLSCKCQLMATKKLVMIGRVPNPHTNYGGQLWTSVIFSCLRQLENSICLSVGRSVWRSGDFVKKLTCDYDFVTKIVWLRFCD